MWGLGQIRGDLRQIRPVIDEKSYTINGYVPASYYTSLYMDNNKAMIIVMVIVRFI